MPKWVMSDVYSMGCALRKEAHEVQMGINMHSVIKQLCGGGATRLADKVYTCCCYSWNTKWERSITTSNLIGNNQVSLH